MTATTATVFRAGNTRPRVFGSNRAHRRAARQRDQMRCRRSRVPAVTTDGLNMRWGLLFLNNRYHDAGLGVFISVDPLVQATGEPYIYAGGNPTTLSDPSGLCKWYLLCTDEAVSALDSVGGWLGDAQSDAARIVAGYVDAAVREVADRGTTHVQYTAEWVWRSSHDPGQFAKDGIAGTAALEYLSGTEAILGEDGELYDGGPFCGEVMECILSVSTPNENAAITTGHTVRFDNEVSRTPTDELTAHEAQHVLDIEAAGAIPFYGEYAAEWVLRSSACWCDGYEDLIAEQRANHVQDNYPGVQPSAASVGGILRAVGRWLS